jgi:hypothetical protein
MSPAKENAAKAAFSTLFYFSPRFSHGWFATPQEVLHADWQEVWHSPQPPSPTLTARSRVSSVLIRSIKNPHISIKFSTIMVTHFFGFVNCRYARGLIHVTQEDLSAE